MVNRIVKTAKEMGLLMDPQWAKAILDDYEPLMIAKWSDDDYREAIRTAVSRMDEVIVKIKSLDTEVYMQYGEDNLIAEDYANGYDHYIDYDILGGVNRGDGGMYMLKDKEYDWTKDIPEAICFALDLDKCPEYAISPA